MKRCFLAQITGETQLSSISWRCTMHISILKALKSLQLKYKHGNLYQLP